MTVVVCGIGRSGTSLDTMIVAALGLDPGDRTRMKPADEKNPLGYFEFPTLLHFFASRVTAKTTAQSTRRFFTEDWENEPGMPELLAEAREVWSSIRTSDNMVLKLFDMGVNRLLWEKVIGEEPIYVVAFREPYESSVSLQDFNEGAVNHSISLFYRLHRWTKAYRELIQSLQGRRVFFIEYGELLADPDRVLNELAAALVAWGACPPDVDIAPARALIRPTLHRNRNVRSVRSRLLKPRTKSMYEALRTLHGQHDALHVENPIFWRADLYTECVAKVRAVFRPLQKVRGKISLWRKSVA